MNDATHIPMRPILTSEARAVVVEAAPLAEAAVDGNLCPAPLGVTTAEPVIATPLRTVSCCSSRNRARFRRDGDEGDQGVGHHTPQFRTSMALLESSKARRNNVHAVQSCDFVAVKNVRPYVVEPPMTRETGKIKKRVCRPRWLAKSVLARCKRRHIRLSLRSRARSE